MAKPIFLAAPDANDADLQLIDKLIVSLQVVTQDEVSGRHVYVPHLAIGDAGVDVAADKWFTKALTAIQDAKVVVAAVDGGKTDDGVAFLMGYAFAAGKPVIAYRTDRRLVPHPLVDLAPATVVSDVKALGAALRPFVAPDEG